MCSWWEFDQFENRQRRLEQRVSVATLFQRPTVFHDSSRYVLGYKQETYLRRRMSMVLFLETVPSSVVAFWSTTIRVT